LTVEQAKGKVEGDELVLVVDIDGVARAYPINMLTGPAREIINDKLGGRLPRRGDTCATTASCMPEKSTGKH